MILRSFVLVENKTVKAVCNAVYGVIIPIWHTGQEIAVLVRVVLILRKLAVDIRRAPGVNNKRPLLQPLDAVVHTAGALDARAGLQAVFP